VRGGVFLPSGSVFEFALYVGCRREFIVIVEQAFITLSVLDWSSSKENGVMVATDKHC
jgi:hypothetical protein